MKQKRDNNNQKKDTGTVNSVQERQDVERNNEKKEEDKHYERHISKRVTKRVYHPDGPGGGYDGL